MAMPLKKVWVIGHRGAMAHAPENTRASFEKGWRLGADAVECDVHLSRDKRPVVIHDGTLDRTTNGRGPVRRRTWAELKTLDAGAWFGPAFRGERLWRLGDLLRWAKPKKSRRGAPLQVVVEIKKAPAGASAAADAVVRALRGAGMVGRAWVISFDPAAARRAKRLCPSLRTGLLFADPLTALDRRVRWAGARGIFPRYSLVTKAMAERARREGWFLATWTVNEVADMRRLRGWGVDAIASNHPERLVRLQR